MSGYEGARADAEEALDELAGLADGELDALAACRAYAEACDGREAAEARSSALQAAGEDRGPEWAKVREELRETAARRSGAERDLLDAARAAYGGARAGYREAADAAEGG